MAHGSESELICLFVSISQVLRDHGGDLCDLSVTAPWGGVSVTHPLDQKGRRFSKENGDLTFSLKNFQKVSKSQKKWSKMVGLLRGWLRTEEAPKGKVSAGPYRQLGPPGVRSVVDTLLEKNPEML